MIRSELKKGLNSRRGLNQLLRLYERNYEKLINFFPISEKKTQIDYLIPEGENNSEIQITSKKLSTHTSILEIRKSFK